MGYASFPVFDFFAFTAKSFPGSFDRASGVSSVEIFSNSSLIAFNIMVFIETSEVRGRAAEEALRGSARAAEEVRRRTSDGRLRGARHGRSCAGPRRVGRRGRARSARLGRGRPRPELSCRCGWARGGHVHRHPTGWRLSGGKRRHHVTDRSVSLDAVHERRLIALHGGLEDLLAERAEGRGALAAELRPAVDGGVLLHRL